MFGLKSQIPLDIDQQFHALEDYAGRKPRWCSGCGDNAILKAVQRFCRDEQISPEKSVFVSGIGCASRFPHYMKTYGFHGLHGRALPIAQGIRIRRPDLDVFVTMGDGDCCSIGTAHWIHTVRMNVKLVAMMHDNSIYGLTKMQVSPTTPRGTKTKTTPTGSILEPLNPLSATLGVTNVSFVAQVVDWMPDLVVHVLKMAHRHPGFAFIRIVQRCPHFMAGLYDAALKDPQSSVLLRHEKGVPITDAMTRMCKVQEEHDPSDLNRAREQAGRRDRIPLGILYRNPDVPRYDQLAQPKRKSSVEAIRGVLDREFDTYTIEASEKK